MPRTLELLAAPTALVAICLVVAACERSGTGAQAQTHPAPSERALPRFEGAQIDGEGRLGTEIFRNRRGLLFLFSERDTGADQLARVVSDLRQPAADANVALLGISRDDTRFDARGFARRHAFDFPVLHDPTQSISRKLGVSPGDAAVLVVDGAGSILLGFSAERGVENLLYENLIRDILRLPKDSDATAVTHGLRPPAPPFEVADLDGETLSLAELEQSVVVIMFFLHTCPHCHDALVFLQGLSRELGSDGLAIVPISVMPSADALRTMAGELEVELELYLDPAGEARKDYGHGGAVPDILILDREHRVVGRHGAIEPRVQALMRMEIRQALGVENPILLAQVGYSGEETCRVCHSAQHETWALTSHAYAFDTLVEHGENKNPECLPCHTVGWQEEGGYSLERPYLHLEGVQCENCHGRGGLHQSPDFLAAGFQATCEGCHNPEHSLRFHFGERLPLVSHAANLRFANLSLEERRALLERRDKRERVLFESAEFVGSESCGGCHRAEYERWQQSPHAQAFATLEARGEAQNAECQRCHTTGFEQAGGFPDGGPDRVAVGCESCHGPGGNHVPEQARRDGTILALTDKCDSCVILQICGSCHDDANDPGFEFEVIDKIDLIRHGFRDREPPEGSAAE